MKSQPPRRLTLEERAESLGTAHRDCRSCRAFNPAPSGMAFGWCDAFEQYVKLYHPSGKFFSQCQFKTLTKPAAGGDDAV